MCVPEQYFGGLVARHALAVRALFGDRREDVGDGHDALSERDLVSFAMERITAPVDLLVMSRSPVSNLFEPLRVEQDERRVIWMLLHDVVLGCGELARLLEDFTGYGELADVAAREKERGDDEAVGGEHQLVRAGKDRAVAQRLQRRVREGGQQHVLYEARGLFPPAAVIERDDLVHLQ